jgi:hypothetical protein
VNSRVELALIEGAEIYSRRDGVATFAEL